MKNFENNEIAENAIENAISTIENLNELEKFLSHCKHVLEVAEECKKINRLYSSRVAVVRRIHEQKRNIEPMEFILDGQKWSIGFSYSESAKYTRMKCLYYRDDAKVKTSTVQKLIDKLEKLDS